MPICLNCGNLPPEGVKFCNKCGQRLEAAAAPPPPPKTKLGYDDVYASSDGIPFDAGDFGGMEVIEDPEQFKKGRTAAPTGLGFSTDGFQEVSQLPVKKEPAKEGASAAEKSKKTPSQLTDEELLEMDLTGAGPRQTRGRRRIEIRGNPYIISGAAVVCAVAALAFPWFYFYEGEPLSAFRLPVIFLFADRADLLPKLTTGIVAAVALAIVAAMAAIPNRIITLSQAAGAAMLILSVGAGLLGLRHWNAAAGLGEQRHASYIESREALLPADIAPWMMFAGAAREATEGLAEQESPERKPAGAGRAPSLGFFAAIYGPGAALMFLGGLLALRGAAGFTSGRNLFDFAIPTSIAAAALTFVSLLLAFSLYIRIMPAHWHYAQSEILRAAGRADAATARLEICVDLPIPDALCKTALARARRLEGRSRDAHTLLMEVISERPEYPAPRKDLADLHFAGANYWKAAEEYRKYYQLRPGDLDARRKFSKTLVYIGNDRYGKARFKEAVRFYGEAFEVLESNRSDTTLLYKIGDANYQMGKLGEALEYLGAAADLIPDKFDLQIQVAKVCEEKGDFERAINYYKKSIDAKPDNSISFVYIARIYRDIHKQPDVAAEWYEKAIEANSVSDGAATARRELENLKY